MNLDALALKVWAEIGNKDGGVPMVRAALAQARSEALEEAAKACEEKSKLLARLGLHNEANVIDDCAAAIRALEVKP